MKSVVCWPSGLENFESIQARIHLSQDSIGIAYDKGTYEQPYQML